MGIYGVPSGIDPVGAWIPSLDDAGNGTTTLTDLVGGNDGVLTNMDAATDWVLDSDAGGGRALDFDGSNDYVYVLDDEVFDISAGSVSMWVKTVRASTDTAMRLVQKGGDGLSVYHRAGSIGFGNNFGFIQATLQVNDGDWHHVTCINDGTNTFSGLSIYIDGVNVPTSTLGTFSGWVGNSSPLTLGGDFHFYDGQLDDIRIYDQEITADDIAYLYSGGEGRGVVSGGDQSRTRLLSRIQSRMRTRL